MLRVLVTKFQVGTILKCHTMDGQMHSIEKIIRPLFTDPVTYKVRMAASMGSGD